MSAGLVKETDLQIFENILIEKKAAEQELSDLRKSNEDLQVALAKAQEDMKAFEPFRPILEQNTIEFYNVRLSGSSMMKQLLARLTKMYGKRFNLDKETGQDRAYARQRMSEAVNACVRYCVMQNSRWNDMAAHYLSNP